MASKAELLVTLQDYCHDQADTTTISTFFNETMEDWARRPDPMFTAKSDGTIQPLTYLITESGDYIITEAGAFITIEGSAFAFADALLVPLRAYYGSRELSWTDTVELDKYANTWRDDAGTPIAITLDERSARSFRLYPTEATTATAFDVIYADDKNDDFDEWAMLPIIYKIMGREFAYPSDHEDVEFASVCDEFSEILYQLVHPQLRGIKNA